MKMHPALGLKGLIMEIHASHASKVENAQSECYIIVHVVHEFWQRFPATHNLTDMNFLLMYCEYSALAHSQHLHYASIAGAHNCRGMRSTERCTGCCTKLYAVRACCTVCNMQAKRFCEAMAKWVMLGADLWNVDGLSSANYFRFGHCVNIGVQQHSFPAPVPPGKAIFALQKNSKDSSSSARWLHTFLMVGQRVDRKSISAGRIS